MCIYFSPVGLMACFESMNWHSLGIIPQFYLCILCINDKLETWSEHVFFSASPRIWISGHLVDKCSVILSSICRNGPCDGEGDKCCCGDHLLSHRNTEESQSVPQNSSPHLIFPFYIDGSFNSFWLGYTQLNCKVEDYEDKWTHHYSAHGHF